MSNARARTGEMPFLDHLEELRWRILWSLLAVVAGTLIGLWAVQHFDVLTLLKRPIAPLLPDGKLHVLHPADAFLITLKLAVVVGLVLGAPVIAAQVWAFVAPALYGHERKYILPALFAGLGLFIIGAVMAYLWVLPTVLRILTSFQHESLEFMITANAYFGFAAQLILAFGLLFELPLVIVILGALGLVSPDTFARHRPLAFVIASIVAALLTPPDALSMVLMLGPIVVLYELGILLARVVGNRRARKALGTAAMLVLALGLPSPATAQDPVPPRRDSLQVPVDSAGRPVDTANARRLGLPTGPSRSFPQADSVMGALMAREGFTALRYAADTITLFGNTKEIVLDGSALVEREGTMLEADSVSFLDSECRLNAAGDPVLFDRGTVLVGEGMHYDTCERRGRVASALTSFEQSGVMWYLRGGLGIDSASVRVYGKSTDMTSCDLPESHYHFAAGKVKWVTNTIMVARPATLYVRDVPVLWLPFIFQDMRQGRRTGLLVPRFGFSDLIRPNAGYRRHVSNIGYYVAFSDYMDAQASLDWYSGNYVAINGQLQYRWLNQFLSGGLSVSRMYEEGLDSLPGGRSLRLQWTHRQSFDQRTSLNANVDYATSARVVERNSVDPFLQQATLGSQVSFQKQLAWGIFSLGGTRRQELSSGTISQTLPTVSLSPAPIDIMEDVTWSPAFSLTNSQTLHQTPGVPILQAPMGGVPVTDTLFPDSRTTNLSLRTPLRIGPWNWANDLRVMDRFTNRPQEPVTVPDPANPGDSLTRYYGEDFSTEVDWSTGINLPAISGGRWNLQPSVNIANSTGGAFLLRNAYTNGEFVSQGKRLSFGASLSPTLFGFFPGVGPIARIRHAISPRVSWNYAPSASVPEAYARAVNPRAPPQLESPTIHSITFGLSQTFEGKLRPPPGDTTDPAEGRKLKVLSIQSSSITYDFEQAQLEGMTGWRTGSLSNQFTSDLLPGFSLSMTHSLWDGDVGSDATRFDPFLTSVSTRFNVNASTFRSIVAMLTGGMPEPQPDAPPPTPEDSPDPLLPEIEGLAPRPGLDPTLARIDQPRQGGRGFQAGVTYDDQRRRPEPGADPRAEAFRANRTLGLNVSFSPTTNWSVAWNTQYNITTGEFGQHVLRLDRDLHRWRATFSFIKTPNGNFAFNFYVSLLDQPDIQFRYDQRTVKR